MLLPVFEKYIFLQSLGWGIANSLWQAALLWMIYKTVTFSGKNLSALFKYHFSCSTYRDKFWDMDRSQPDKLFGFHIH